MELGLEKWVNPIPLKDLQQSLLGVHRLPFRSANSIGTGQWWLRPIKRLVPLRLWPRLDIHYRKSWFLSSILTFASLTWGLPCGWLLLYCFLVRRNGVGTREFEKTRMAFNHTRAGGFYQPKRERLFLVQASSYSINSLLAVIQLTGSIFHSPNQNAPKSIAIYFNFIWLYQTSLSIPL